ncbi:hypothetical protein DVH02_21630 [Streptomyces corynorhini]|uniref:Uncharacterized protein n=1 Tax=Streptomyces corynorhini TaxID=2282652 RepID=A0A370B651_9ACTN|nr:hypothetical protein DVH02_21630 [Streptomyces corynorhini]
MRSHAPDAVGPALRADGATFETRPSGACAGRGALSVRAGSRVRGVVAWGTSGAARSTARTPVCA